MLAAARRWGKAGSGAVVYDLDGSLPPALTLGATRLLRRRGGETGRVTARLDTSPGESRGT